MNIQRSKLNLALVPGTEEPEKIFHYPNDTKLCTTRQRDTSKTDTPARPSHQVSIVENVRQRVLY